MAMRTPDESRPKAGTNRKPPNTRGPSRGSDHRPWRSVSGPNRRRHDGNISQGTHAHWCDPAVGWSIWRSGGDEPIELAPRDWPPTREAKDGYSSEAPEA